MPRDGTFTKPDTETAALLRKAKALINTPEKWCRDQWAKNCWGDPCPYDGPQAVRRCADGALMAAGAQMAGNQFLIAAAREMGFGDQVHLNDNTDHPTVMAMFDLAERMAREEG